MRSLGRPALAIAVNNLVRLARQPLILFTTLALPFIVITVVGLALRGNAGTLDAGVVDHGTDQFATGLATALDRSSALHVVRYGSDADLETAVRRGQVDAGIEIPAGYGDALLRGNATIRFVTTPDQTRAAAVRALTLAAVNQQTQVVQSAVFAQRYGGVDLTTAMQRARALSPSVVVPAVVALSVASPATTRLGFDYTAPSNLVLFVVITSLTSSAALIETRVRGITDRMFTFPVSRWAILSGELLGRFLVAAIQAAVVLVVATLAFGVDWGAPSAVAALTGALCLFGAALGMLVGFAARTVGQAVSFGPPVGILLGMLGGCMWPLAIVGDTLRRLGHVSPDAWAMDGYLKLINQGAGLTAIVPQVVVILGYAALAVLLAGAVIRRRRI
ncbi:MAG TPA: ABC transporter permease [Rugosimonospora sp.]|nr:ABC transporter permease [Rugosimonospora sp.]